MKPAMLNTEACAAYRSVHPSYVIVERQNDMARRSLGYPMKGPRWLKLGGRIFYARKDVDAWIRKNGEYGAVDDQAIKSEIAKLMKKYCPRGNK